MTTSWGGTSIPDPVSLERSEEHVGAQYVVASGAMVTDSIATKYRFALSWGLITTAERDTIRGKATTQASAALVAPGVSSTNVEPVRNTYRESAVGITPVWNVSCEVRTT